jgi:hypothetical protein
MKTPCVDGYFVNGKKLSHSADCATPATMKEARKYAHDCAQNAAEHIGAQCVRVDENTYDLVIKGVVAHRWEASLS